MAAEGLLLQLDGSRHDWLEGRGPGLTLVGAIDDATGKVPAAVFRLAEDTAAYLEVLATTVRRHGIPGAVYHDRHGSFAPTTPGLLEPGAEGPLSQLGRALVELGIDSIVAGSAQAKGRIERLWGTFQDRLVVELRLAGIADLAAANAFLPGFLERFNARFSVPATDPLPAWRPVPDGLRLERILVFKYRARSPATTRSTSPGGCSSCRAVAAVEGMPGGSWRFTSGSTAPSSRSTASVSWSSRPPRTTRSSCGPNSACAPTQASCPHLLACPGSRHPSIPGDGCAATASSTGND
jgi:hypothetical protein